MKSFNKKEAMRSYITAADLLPEKLWWTAFSLDEDDRIKAEEFRLRKGMPFSVILSGKSAFTSDKAHSIITDEDIEIVISKATGCSFHSFADQISQGFITVKGGHRIGICGRIVNTPSGLNIDNITSLNIRIAKEIKGISEELLSFFPPGLHFGSTLIISPPGGGKTTLLRDMCRILSENYRVSVADCRCEISGNMNFDMGYCDVMQGGSKAETISMLVKSMSPEIIALDEITDMRDVKAIAEASYLGCGFIATAHGENADEMRERPVYRKLLGSRIFDRLIFIERQEDLRIARIYERRGNDKDYRCTHDNILLLGDGAFFQQGDEKKV